MRKIRVTLIAGALTAIVLAIAPAASGASAANERCVGDPPCFATIQKAVDVAHNGDVIRIGPGTFAGGVTIDKSVELVGSGASKTTIEGGGPVLTIGKAFAPREPKVAISKVKITGGHTTSSPLSKEFVGKKNVIALGGGIAIPPGRFIKAKEHFAAGATVKVADSVITNNRVGPTATVPSGLPCPGGDCPFAAAGGGGIDTWGALTLDHTEVGDNLAAGVASDATGGGIDSPQGSLDLSDSTITSNRAIAGVPHGRYAEGGGIFTGGILGNDAPVEVRVRGGSISDNEASLRSRLPYFVGDGKGSTIDMNANGGGAHLGGGSSISIANARISENEVGVDDPKGEPYAFDSALLVGEGSKLDVSHSTIEDNRVRAKVGSSKHVGPSGGAFDINGPTKASPGLQTVSHVRFTGNTTLVTSKDGGAQAAPGAIYNGTTTRITHSVISGNRITALSAKGSAGVFGAGGVNDEGRLLLQGDLIEDNHAIAIGPKGYARGGGIWNGHIFGEQPPHLTLEHTRVIGNTLSASPGLPVEGGGIFTAFPVTLDHSQIAHNHPDQCAGSGCKKGS
jgi:hypothetical protein